MIAQIKQPCGLGDILFCQKIAHKIIEKYNVDQLYWPVSKYYNYLNDYIKLDKLVFIDENINFPYGNVYTSPNQQIIVNDELLYVPLQSADYIVPYNHNTANHPMYCKYELVGLDYTDWTKYVNIIRNPQRECNLIKHLNYPKDYIIVNRTFGTYPNQIVSSEVPKFDNEVEVTNLGFDNPFDWIKLFENAKEIHTVETSFTIILAALGIKNVNVYPRNAFRDFRHIKNLFPADWTLKLL